jgi:DNA-binding IclR family transcriptional regulator
LVEISLTGDQMLTVLETVAENGPISAAEVARICAINRTVAYRLLVTLAQRSYVRRSEAGYVVGPAVLNVAKAADPGLINVAKPFMEQLARETGETVVLHAIDGYEAVVIAQALGGRHLVRVEHQPGSRHPLYLGASAKAILAFQPKKFADRVLRKLPNADDMLTLLETIRRNGFAISHDELQQGVHGIAAPLHGNNTIIPASIAILVPAARQGTLQALVRPLLEAAKQIENKFV